MDRFLIHSIAFLCLGMLITGCSKAPESSTRDDRSARHSSGEPRDSLAEQIVLPPAFQDEAPAASTTPQNQAFNRPSTSKSLSPKQAKSRTNSAFGEQQPTAAAMRMPNASADVAMSASAAPTTSGVKATTTLKPVQDDTEFQTVDVYYATDRQQGELSLADYQLTGQPALMKTFGIGAGVSALLFVLTWLMGWRTTALLSGGLTLVLSAGALAILASGKASIEKTGVTYTGERGSFERGVCRVTVPKSHTLGSVERPSILKFEVNEDQTKHIVLTSVTPLKQDRFQEELKAALASSKQPDLLVFIHGYNVNFESAVHRTAQISVDLPFEGVPVCYSWPSQGTLLGYPIDENNAAWTVGHLREFLMELVEQSGANSIHVVAHSMGNRAMTSALHQLSLTHEGDDAIFDRVVLAAPDVDADLFRKDLAPALTQVAKHVTLYASSDDQALIASKQVHGYPRAGETGAQLVIVQGVDTIDVSGIDLSLLGHSYYGDSQPMLRDLFEVLLSRLPASQRDTLVSRDFESNVYWQLAVPNGDAGGVAP